MFNVTNQAVKELIEALQELHRSTTKKASLSDLQRIYGISRQNLANWMKSTPEQSRLFEFIEKARKDLEWDEVKTYKKTVKKK
jgi:hypothetical protein